MSATKPKFETTAPLRTFLQIGEMIFSRSLNISNVLLLDERVMRSISDVIVYYAEAPKLDLSKLAGREIRVRAGEPIRVDVPVTGSPPPVISWQKENKALSPSDRVSLAFDAARVWTDRFSGPGRVIGLLCVCLRFRTTTVE